jgi:hypothetical protein
MQEALETHKEAYTMRANTLGEAHGETAMSLNQVRKYCQQQPGRNPNKGTVTAAVHAGSLPATATAPKLGDSLMLQSWWVLYGHSCPSPGWTWQYTSCPAHVVPA